MKKNVLGKLRHLMCVVVLFLLGLLITPVCVEATEERVTKSEESVDNDALFEQYLDHLMYPDGNGSMTPGNAEDVVFRSGAARSALTKYGETVYDYLLEQLQLVANGELELCSFDIPYDSVYGSDATFFFTAEELGFDSISQANLYDALNEINAQMGEKNREPGLGDVVGAIGADVPYLLYWHSGMVFYQSAPDLELVSYTDDSITVKPAEGRSFCFEYDVSQDYQGSDYNRADTAKTSIAKRSIDYAKEIVRQAVSMSDTEKLDYYKTSICGLVSYDFEAPMNENNNPWQILYVFDRDPSTNVVCEGYAKAFKYLCDLTTFSSAELECRLAAGYLIINDEWPERHMWNVVQLKKGENYLVDVTNCDEGMFGEPDILYMCGGIERISKTINNTECWGYRINHPTEESVCYYYDDSSYNSMMSENELVLVGEVDETKAFVSRLYVVCLGREAEEDGLNQWTSQLKSGEKKAVDIVQGVLCSPEYMSKGRTNEQIVTDCYNAMLGRDPDQDGFDNWVTRLDSGMSINAIFAGFVGSPEFEALCAQYNISPGVYPITEERDRNAGVTQFVGRLYTKALGRNYDVDGLNDWCGRINNDSSRENILSVATNGFFHSREFLNKNLSNEDFVTVCYRTYLGREPEPEGFSDWVGQLDRGEKDRDRVMEGFAFSMEFGNIMEQYGL